MSHNRKHNKQITQRQEMAVAKESSSLVNTDQETNASTSGIHRQMVYGRTDLKRGLPKNIRQIGEPEKSPRIYVEDYVVTYLNQLAHPTNAISRGAILLGNWQDMDGEQVLFISGAVEAENLSFDLKEIEFTNETWTSLYEKIQCYVEDVEVVGWFLSRLGYSIRLTDTMLRVHRKYFPKEGSVLYLLDALEQEDAFFVQEQEQLAKQGGYYIYYERNAQMQNYLIENQAIERQSPAQKRIAYKDEQLLHSYHEIMAARAGQKKDKKIAAGLYAASALFIVIFLAFGINIFNNYDKLKSMQSSLDKMLVQQQDIQNGKGILSNHSNHLDADTNSEANAESKEVDMLKQTSTKHTMGSQAEAGVTEEAASQTSNTVASISASGNQREAQDVNLQADEVIKANESVENIKTQNANTTQENISAASMGRSGNYYVVKQGDTLLSISKAMYQSELYVDVIRDANSLGEEDYIYPGQQIVIPSID